MKILITGSNGLLGQKLVKLLSNKKNIELIATSKGENRISKTQGYPYYSLDITNQTQVNELINQLKPNIIINTCSFNTSFYRFCF